MSPDREPLPTRVRDTAPLPAAYDQALRAGLASGGVDSDGDARQTLDGHVRLLLAWTHAINLTSIRDPAAVATVHVLDSLTGLPILRALGVDQFLDLGSGGGFPGIPLAATLPDIGATLLEPTGKKARFLETAVEAIGLAPRVTVVRDRAETLAATDGQREGWPAVTARAVATLGGLIELSFPLLEVGGTLIAWKRGDIRAELAAGTRAAAALGGGSVRAMTVDAAGLADHRLVIATRTGRVPDRYPRPAAARRREPW